MAYPATHQVQNLSVRWQKLSIKLRYGCYSSIVYVGDKAGRFVEFLIRRLIVAPESLLWYARHPRPPLHRRHAFLDPTHEHPGRRLPARSAWWGRGRCSCYGSTKIVSIEIESRGYMGLPRDVKTQECKSKAEVRGWCERALSALYR